ncbi:MAG TPA: hypothetical protein VNF46_03265 [Gammaproteobacteria bacterium]|nr:hypothetical protein [Gammaproteobacteria bacterium]
MSVRAWLLLSLLTLCLLNAPIQAAPLSPGLYSSLHWRMLGPFRAGRALAVSGVPGEPNHFYFGAVDGGVWETHDAGRTWTPIFDQQPVGSIGAIAVAHSDPKVIYVGSGEADMRSDIGYGNGMYKSTDSGQHWTHIGLTDSQQIGAVLVDPQNANTVYVAALGHAYGANAERGVFKSSDGGSTWKKLLFKNDDTGAIDLAFGGSDQTLFAALWQTRRPPWNVYPPSNGPGSGLYVTHDAGDHWTQIRGRGFPEEGVGRIGVAVSASNPQIVYALVDATQGGLYKSSDGGVNWTRISDDQRIWQRGWYFSGVSVDPKNPETVYVCDTVIYKSTDGGKSFLPMKGDPTGDDYHSLWIDPDNTAHMIAGSDQGVIITLNGGRTWSSWYNQPIAQIYHVTTDNQFPYWVYGAQQDSGAVALPSSTNTGDGIGMMQFTEITAGGESGYLAVDPRHPNYVYGSDYDGGVDRLDTTTEQTQSLGPTLAYPGQYRRVWTMPLVFSPADSKALYFGNQKIFRTDDGGQHWSIISPDLSRPEPGVPSNLDAVTAVDASVKTPRRGVIYSIAPSPRKKDLIWAGTDDGLVWVTRDAGKHWANVTPPQLTSWSKVASIEAGHFSPDTAYLAVDRHRLNDYQPYIYVTHDGGKSWKLIVNGIPDGSFVNVVREDPVKQDLLYAGTEMGVFVSFDGGNQWQGLQQNLPVTSVRDIDVHDTDLVIATHGRGFWIMDDVTPLRQLTTKVAQAHAWLFEPALAYRVLPAGFTGTPLPADEPHAQNPPLGAYIDYYLGAPAYTPVTLDIYDYLGNPVRHFSSDTPPQKTDLSKINSTPDWVTKPTPLSASVGVHRFVWDLRYALPQALRRDDEPAGGLWVVPGKYTVRLSVNGKSYNQPLTVLKDPRVEIFTISLSHQLKFAQQIESARVQVAEASHSIESLLKQLRSMKDKVSSKLAGQIAALTQKLDAISGITPANPDDSVGVPPPNMENLNYLGGALADLEHAVESADAAPTTDARTGFKLQSKALEPVMHRWRQVQLVDLPQLNAALQNAGLAPLKF